MAILESQAILEKARQWMKSDTFDPETVSEVSRLVAENNLGELTDRFYKELSFGTGGMRGIMGAGTARINSYNLRKACTAVSQYLNTKLLANQPKKIAICYDSRHNSKDFAKSCAEVFVANGFEVLLFKEMRPVSYLSFLIRSEHCAAGVFITASHNPPKYNGFKVYWSDGAQIVGPHDEAIVAKYEAQKGYDLARVPYQEALAKGLVCEISQELDKSYLAVAQDYVFVNEGKESYKIVYSPLHGTGVFAIPSILKMFGFSQVLIPEEQKTPDGNFPSVKSPNPEEPEALTIALEYARKQGADLVLATDPDADRLGVVCREADDSFKYLNGNEIACLLTDFLFCKLKQAKKLPAHPYIVKTIVTTDLLALVAKDYDAKCYDTLTGFKWIAALIESRKTSSPAEQFICGGEESFGFLAGENVRDKDAVLSAAIASELFCELKTKGLTATQALDQLFLKHGYFLEKLLSFTFEGALGSEKIIRLMQAFREAKATLCGYPIAEKIDYLKGLGELLPSDVLEFRLAGGLKVCVRPSGTEPKLKLYLSATNFDVGASFASLALVKQSTFAAMEEFAARMQEFVAR